MNLHVTDPEFMERFEHFAFDEVPNEEGQQLDDETRYMVILATLIGCQGMEEYRLVLSRALDGGFAPIAVKEIVYQAVDYLGIGRVLPYLEASNSILESRGIKLPLEGQCTTTTENRLEKGIQAQADIFGEHMKEAWKAGHINRWLAANCFGDYYTRTGLDLAQREMITFCFLAAQGGCEPQLTAHAAGNMNLGNDKEFLIRVVSQCLPYIGYPRSLNAINCINKAADPGKKTLFPMGGPNNAFASYFVGQSFLNMLTTEGVPIGNVTFEPGCRNNWHIHKADKGGGQILLCTNGRGWYQEWGREARELFPGDVVTIPAGIKHWHGAAKDSWFTHLAVEGPGENTGSEWVEPVDKAAYAALK